jgi:hypothetical protein
MPFRRIEGLNPSGRRRFLLEATIWGLFVIESIAAAILFFTRVAGVWVLVIAPVATLVLSSVRYWMQAGPRRRSVLKGHE